MWCRVRGRQWDLANSREDLCTQISICKRGDTHIFVIRSECKNLSIVGILRQSEKLGLKKCCLIVKTFNHRNSEKKLSLKFLSYIYWLMHTRVSTHTCTHTHTLQKCRGQRTSFRRWLSPYHTGLRTEFRSLVFPYWVTSAAPCWFLFIFQWVFKESTRC